ncbi:MAG: TonB-dependent receptor [Opitutaceae bacterium]|nr:TonB-dependent receptor [Opitutaceae bacterium]
MHPFRSHSLYVLTAALAAAQVQPPPDHRHDHDEPLALENFVISASPYARSQADLAQPTSVLAGRELTLRMAPTLGELLAGQPGVSSSWFGPGASRPVIRGLSGDRIRVLENSLGTTDASIISPDHAVSLDPLLIERVEVVRGPAALLYGGNAVGGVVNVITHRIHTSLPDTPVQGRFEVRGNSADREESGGLVLEGAAGPIAWHADYYHRRTSDVKIPGFAESARRRAMEEEEHHHDDEHDEHDDHEEEDPVFGRIPNTALRNEGGAFGLSFIGRRGYFGLSHSAHDSRYGIPAGVHAHHHGEEDHDDHDHDEDHGDEHGEEDENVTIDLRQRRWEFQGEITEPFGVFRGARFKLGTARYRHTEFEGDEVGTVFRNRGHDGRVELLHQPLGAFSGAVGWQGGRSDFEADGDEAFVPPSRTTTNALFLFEEAELAPFTWQVGARAEKQDLALRDGSGIKRDDTALSLSTGIVWKLDDTWTLAASLARTQRAPNVQELYADGPHAATAAYEIGNADLRRERSLALDLSLRKRAGFVTGEVTVFTHRFNGFIFEVPTGEIAVPHHDHWHFHGGHDHDDHGHHDDHDHHHDAEGGLPVYRFIQRDARFHGAELEAIFHLHGDGANQLDLIVGADFVRGRNRGDGEHLPRITPARSKAGLVWSHGPWVLGGEVQWVAGQHRTAPNELPTDSYDLVSAYATYRHVVGRTVWDFFLRGTNLGDAEARVHTSLLKDVAPLAGRSVSAGVRLSF